MKLCRTCKIKKPKKEFSPEPRSADGLGYRCKSCNRKRRRKQSTKHRKKWSDPKNDPYKLHPTGKKHCQRCHRDKPTEDFSRDRCGQDGLQRWCRKCAVKEYQIRTYGESLPDNATCGICGESERMVIDHDHKTGKVRGFLCRSCNIGLGCFNDSQKKLSSAIGYLKRTT